MSASRQHEKAQGAGSTFWKKSSISALPGRPNLSQAGSGGPGVGPKASLSFRDFDASVSDAWSNNEPLPPTLGSTAGDVPAAADSGAGAAQEQYATVIQPPVIPPLSVATGRSAAARVAAERERTAALATARPVRQS